ncbi:hypothetical protein HPULCUR_011033 [Helicostylum pulchrum]|uniref:Uncharacterized protein n=1 Tax=Helicostylum pulchrum TaxID=562976 RepID=A0ABP9YF00_9FUNG
MIKTKEAGGSTDFVHHPMLKQSLSSFPAPEKISLLAVEVCLLEYPLAFIELQDLFKKDDIDLVICDSFSIVCIDAAIVSKLPVIISTTMGTFAAFGQHVSPLNRDMQLIMTNLLRLLEKRIIDGIIWANFNLTQVPEKIITDDQEYFDNDIIHHKDIKLVGWVSQYAILEHPSTSFFVSHGGAGSLHEALYNGVRLFVYPFFGDQPGNAIAIERIGVGRHISTINQQHSEGTYRKMYKELYELAVDAQDKIQKATDRYRAYIQVRSVHAVIRGADYMEESLFASDDEGNLYYRNDVGYEIHWIKRNNVDIYAVFTTVGFIVLKFTSIMYNLIRKNGFALHKVKRA